MDFLKGILILFLLIFVSGCAKVENEGEIIPSGSFNVSINIDTNSGRTSISPYIYGVNQDIDGVKSTARRTGGNRLTGYNWETNYSNAGSDWKHSSDYFLPWYMGIPQDQYSIPAIVLTKFHDQSLQMGAYSAITLQMAGYVAKDANGEVSESETAPSPRWAEVKFKKGQPFSTSPDINDNYVYMDELLNYLINKYGLSTSDTGIKGYLLDNEPELWPNTHPRIHPKKLTCEELLNKSVELAKVIKEMDPNAEVFGDESYGFKGFLDLQEAPDWSTKKGSHKWFISWYLEKMKEASDQEGKRLLDVLSVHWYPEASSSSGVRICSNEGDITGKDISIARMQAPRTLWDPTYKTSAQGKITAGENSWINQWFPNFLPILPTIKNDIDIYYPGTKLAITEFDYGAKDHISGGIALVDVLGIFGKYGVYLATRWGDSGSYAASAYNIYLDYDGNGSKYGDTAVSAETSNVENMPVYASIQGSDDSKLHLIIINRSWDKEGIAQINIQSDSTYSSGTIYAFDYKSPTIREKGKIDIQNNTFELKVPPLSVYHLVIVK
ncbi:MAG TPA: glycoside hydrolase family 44 protein [Dictyoglomaceae bacterium]|nr:glycoside hydrolase family 44 protein [Dictyoglomaceae bacterium]HOL39857.1 glycoside hydrolase family 44 protein [Dictyoglomaceae bacterium]HOP95548.1 glycoside hydrolase family 44 protein [Dictyoglomaceae bacterium]HPP16348.1 glycoside hydrolase family 44 protein [Dictyoglomaceae bacterium]HPU43418.1 glycoside hydrolase family 44 protein [Dictyoglomaceae bacterium]